MNGASYDENFRTAFQTLFAKYFNGASHTFGTVTTVFPDCQLIFDRQQFPGPFAKPNIQVMPLIQRVISRHANGNGIRKIFMQSVQILVWTSDPNKLWDVNKKISDLIETVINGDPGVLANLGFRPVSIEGPVPIAISPDQDKQCTQRTASFRVQLDYDSAA